MTTDIKELLELAAKACGVPLKADFKERFDYYMEDRLMWRPHLDDGDGARMEAERAISPYFHGDAVTSTTSGQVAFEDFINITELLADHNGNRQAARRMASLRVAAEIGRRMKCE